MGDVGPLLVVTGTRREASVVAGEGVIGLAGGGDAVRLAAELARLAPLACGIVSFGTGGALDPALGIGDMVIGSGMAGCDRGAADPGWMQALSRRLPRARIGPVFADGTLLATAAAKEQAGRGGAIIADMESHLAAAAAAHQRLPFAILRCVSDTSQAELPPAVALAMRPDGSLALGAILGSLLRQPAQMPALIRTGYAFSRSFQRLQAAVAATGSRLAFDERS